MNFKNPISQASLPSRQQQEKLSRIFMTAIFFLSVAFLEFSYGLPPDFAAEGTQKPMTAIELKQKVAKVRQDLEFERKLDNHLSKAKSITEKLKSANSTMGKGLRLIGKLLSEGESEKAILKEIDKVNSLISPHFRVDKDGNLIWGDALRSLMMLGGVQAQFIPPGLTALTPETADQIVQDWQDTNQAQKGKNEELLKKLTRSGITLEVSASSLKVNQGDLVKYTYVVTNEGGASVENLTITDFSCRDVKLIHKGDTDDLLAPKERWTYECSTDIKEDTTSIVTAKGRDLLGNAVEFNESLTVVVSEAKSSMYTIDVSVEDKSGNRVKDVVMIFPGAKSVAPGESEGKGTFTIDLDRHDSVTIRATAKGYQTGYFRETAGSLKKRSGRKDNRIPVRILLEKFGRPKDSELKVEVADSVDFDKVITTATVTVRYNSGPTNYEKSKKASSGAAIFSLDTYALDSPNFASLPNITISAEAPGYEPYSASVDAATLESALDKNRNQTHFFLPLIPKKKEEKADPSFAKFVVTCFPTVITVEETSQCTAELFREGSSEHVEGRATWTYEPDYAPFAFDGRIHGDEVNKTIGASLPRKIKVTVQYKEPRTDGGKLWSQSVAVLVKPKDRGPVPPTTVTKSPNCPPPGVDIPTVTFMNKGVAVETLQKLNLLGRITEEHSYHYEAGIVFEQDPYEGKCVDPKTTKVNIKVSLGPPEITQAPFTAEFTCGDSFELSPNEVLYPKTCYVRASNFRTTRERVELEVQYNRRLLDITFDKQSEAPKVPHNEFLLTFRTRTTASPGETSVTIVVRHGDETVRIPVTIAILPPGQEPSSGPGIRPPATVATGSEGGAYCVWRSKSFGDGPNCFNITRAQCDNPKYAGKSKYELVGSGMTEMESAARASQLSPYKGDAYGCHRQPPETPGSGEGGQNGGGGSDTGASMGTGEGQGTGAGEGTGEGTGEGEGTEEEGQGTGEGTSQDQEPDGAGEDDDLLAGFPDAPGDAPTADDDLLTPEQAEAVEGFGESGPTSHLPPSDPDQMVSGESSDTPPVDIAAVAQAERDKAEARNQDRQGIQRDADRQADEDQQAINQQNAQDQQTQDAAAQQGVAQAQAQGQVLIDQANQNADPIMSGQDMAGAIDQIQQEGEDKIQAIDDQIRQGLGGGGQGSGSTRQPLPPPPSMGTGPVDTDVVQCNAEYGAGGDNPGFFTIDFKGATGVAEFKYNTETVKDEVVVSAGGATYNSTCRSGGETVSFNIPSPNTPVTVAVKPNCDCKKPKCTGTHWSFTFYCPTGGGGAAGTPQGPGIPPRGMASGGTPPGPGFPSGGSSAGGTSPQVGVPPSGSAPPRTPPRTSSPPPRGTVPSENPSGGLFGF